MNRRKLLVCGATGFIGRNLVETLARRDDLEIHAVRFSRPPFEVPGVVWHQADLRNPDEVTRTLTGMDVVIHAAAVTSGSKQVVTRPHIHVTDNAVMTALLLRAAFDLEVKHVLFTSCSVMYPSREQPWREEEFDIAAPLHPRYFGAGWTKLYAEKMCEFYAAQGRTRHTVIRHSNIYGPYDKFDLENSHVFGATVTKVMTATDGHIGVWGTGEEARDLLHVDDLVDFIGRAIDRQTTPLELLNVGSGAAVRVRDLVARIIAASGRPLEIVYDPAGPSIPISVSLDCARAARLFDWQPRIALDDGIRSTLEWWRQHHGTGHGHAAAP